MDFAMELPATYNALYVLNMGATETILSTFTLVHEPQEREE